ncbi:efflux RND transporter periplasmic adaptor subunit [Rubinisphaera italica]|uniref:Macrolide export protein MacA n=1 Tax=Rubinisphaera italica TaxID=2527969 RepID=A0A5C5XH19_9PLAN|nr:efflux RND transporter periplasmic adaptor subunit [Rubinisphaera italica]TWT61583.1 Macrolide export protein MacA [Rubinisphaera italica]
MKLIFKLFLIALVIGGAGYFAYKPAMEYYKKRNQPEFRTEKTELGTISSIVNATGNIEPVLSVHVGSFVSGPITHLHVDFNDEVEKDQLLAEIDPRIYEASVARDQAILATRKAEVTRILARLQNAVNDERRAMGLSQDNEDFISQTELDQYKFSRMALDAELIVAKANIDQAEANLKNSLANLEYTKIRSPVDGVVIDRKIDPGQTLAAQFQTPELFIIAPDMRKEMHVFASVDEADIGLIRQAQEAGQTVKFTVDAYPGELFSGTISQIRLSSAITQNVVTYPVVVTASNEDLKLLPGMTAEISFKIQEKFDVTKIPNAALRYYPKREHVRPEDHKILDGTDTAFEAGESVTKAKPADLIAEAHLESQKRHVWVREGDLLRAIEVVMGISDYKFTEMVSGDLKADQELVIGVKSK